MAKDKPPRRDRRAPAPKAPAAGLPPAQVEAMLESEERFRLLTETITEVFWIADVPNSRMSYVSPGYERVWGRPREDLYKEPRSFIDAVHPEDRERVLAELAGRKDGAPCDHEYRIIRPDGSVRWIWDQGFPVIERAGRISRYVGVAHDITERKKAEDESKVFSAAVAHAYDSILLTDMDGRVTYANDSARQALGYSPREFAKLRITDLCPHSEAVRRVVGEALEKGRWVGDLTSVRKDKEQFPSMLSVSVVKDDKGRGTAMLCVFRDMTERRRVAAERTRIEEQLWQAQKMDAVGRLAGGVAHDFNNLLIAISAYSDFVLATLGADDPRRADVEGIKRAGERAAALTRQLLAFSRKQMLQPRLLDLNTVLRDVEKLLRRIIGEDISFEILPCPEPARIVADQGHLEQVIMNLSLNARDAMEKGGRLRVSVSLIDLTEVLVHRHGAVPPGSYVMMSVSDTGSGMSEEVKWHLFEPFFTTKERGKGTGLGLSTVYGIISQSGGHIAVQSEEGRGTEFKVFLPRASASAEARLPAPAVKRLFSGPATILLVEDDALVRELARRSLTEDGFTVLEAGGGEQALEICASRSGPIDLIIADMVLPGISGPEFVSRLAPARARTPVLYMTGYSDHALLHQRPLGPETPFLHKPFTPAALTRMVRETLSAAPPSSGGKSES